jgi:hypothetical protein
VHSIMPTGPSREVDDVGSPRVEVDADDLPPIDVPPLRVRSLPRVRGCSMPCPHRRWRSRPSRLSAWPTCVPLSRAASTRPDALPVANARSPSKRPLTSAPSSRRPGSARTSAPPTSAQRTPTYKPTPLAGRPNSSSACLTRALICGGRSATMRAGASTTVRAHARLC